MKKVCFIGACGHVGQTYLLLKQARAEEISFAGFAKGSENEDDTDFSAGKMPYFDSYTEMLDSVKPDIAVVSPIFGLTGGIILECARRGIDVFAEKPIARSLPELALIRDAVKKSGINLGAMHYLRYDPEFYTAIKLLDSGAIGKIRMITSQKSYKYGKRPAWYSSEELYVGIIPWVAIHSIDLIYRISGEKFRTVSAILGGTPEANEMTSLCQFGLTGGIIASVNADFYRPGGAKTHGDDRVRVVGDRGVLEVIGGKIRLTDSGGESEIAPEAVPNELDNYLVGKFAPSADEIFDITEAALLAKEASRTGRVLSFGRDSEN